MEEKLSRLYFRIFQSLSRTREEEKRWPVHLSKSHDALHYEKLKSNNKKIRKRKKICEILSYFSLFLTAMKDQRRRDDRCSWRFSLPYGESKEERMRLKMKEMKEKKNSIGYFFIFSLFLFFCNAQELEKNMFKKRQDWPLSYHHGIPTFPVKKLYNFLHSFNKTSISYVLEIKF